MKRLWKGTIASISADRQQKTNLYTVFDYTTDAVMITKPLEYLILITEAC